jgi:hypothetical protein
MIKRALLMGLLVATVAATSGCCLPFRGRLLCPFGPGCDPQYCGSPCGPACGPGCGAVCDAPCAPDCGPPCPPDCRPCGPYFGPLSWLFAQFRWIGCHRCATCGETYWGGYCSDPPDCCDPCDRCGNWTGGGCGVGAADGNPGAGYAIEGQGPGGYQRCGQSQTASSGPTRVVSRTNQAVNAANSPTLAPNQASAPHEAPVRR